MEEWMENKWIWNVKLVESKHLQEEEESKQDIFLSILHNVQLKQQVDDSFVWWRNKNVFSVKGSYQTIEELSNVDVQVKESIILHMDPRWLTNAPNKILIFRWRLLLNQLPTKSPFATRGIINGNHNTMCPLCFGVEETISNIYKWLDIFIQPELDLVVNNLNNFRTNLKDSVKKNFQLVIWLAVCWTI
ncbi:uncharacterized protein LOC131650988 [Vicia villosa]|nr:uncharacterized protein LOC131650988 [Vicia villosa]